MNRREFVRGAALTAGSILTLPHINFAKSDKHIIILGAGLAGLSAAYQLKQHNVPFTILEASNRIGGRVFTHTIDEESGLTVELGAEWIGESHEKLKKLCTEFHLTLNNHQFNTHLTLGDQYFKPTQWGFEAKWADKYKALLENFKTLDDKKQKELDKLDWWRYLVNNGISEQDLELRELLDSTDFGETIRNVSAFAGLAEYAWSSPKNEMDFHVDGGNYKIIKALQEKLGDNNILMNSRAVKVEQTGKKVKVYTENGIIHIGDKVICALPTFAINQINWSPVFSLEKAQALNELQYARIAKSCVLFSDRFWNDESFDMFTDSSSHYYYHATKNQKGLKGALTSYASGDRAYIMAKMNELRKREEVNSSLKIGFGDVKDKIEKITTYNWSNDPYTKGAYAIYDTKQWFSLRPVIKEAHLNVLFCGEHLGEWQGFMEGAIQSGEDVALGII